MRTGRGFGMVLDGKNGQFFVTETFDGVIIEIQMRQFAAIGHGIPLNAEAVIL